MTLRQPDIERMPGLGLSGLAAAPEELPGPSARDRGTHERLMRRLARVSLLVAGDRGLQGFSAEGRRDLPEIVEPTIADSVLDRIVQGACRIELAGLCSHEAGFRPACRQQPGEE